MISVAVGRYARKQVETKGPLIIGTAFAILCAVYGIAFFEVGEKEKWEIGTLFSSVFDLSSMAAAFLFAFYTFILTAESEFFKAVKATAAYEQFEGYLIVALLFAAFLTVLTVPFMIINPRPTVAFDWVHMALIVWSFVVGYTLSATWRCTRQFATITLLEGRVRRNGK